MKIRKLQTINASPTIAAQNLLMVPLAALRGYLGSKGIKDFSVRFCDFVVTYAPEVKESKHQQHLPLEHVRD